MNKESGRGVGQFTFIDIDRKSVDLKFRILNSIWLKDIPLPHIMWENGEHLPHPQLVEEILGTINK